jgi:collagen type VII alpha
MANEFIARKGLLVLGDAGINGNLGVTGNADIIGDISATGNVGITGNTDIAGAVSVTGNVGITGNTNVNGAVSVTGNAGITGNLNVQGSISATGTLSNYGNINITGNSYFLQGTNTSSGNVSLIGVNASDQIGLGNAGYDIDVQSDLLLDGINISMTGDIGLTGTLSVNGTAGITGYFGVTGTSQVDGTANVNGTAGVTGYMGITGILQVDGTAEFAGYIGATADIKVFSNGEVNPILFIDEDQFFTFFDPGNVGGVVFLRTTSLFTGLTSTIDQTLVVNGGIVATQMALTGNAPSYLDIDGNLSVTGNVGVTGISQITGTANVNGTAGVTGYLGVTGISQIDGTANVNGTAGVTGYLGVTGISQIDGTANVNGTAGVTGYLGVTGTHNISGTANVTGYLGVSGAGTVLSVTGNSVFNGDVDVIGNLNYTGDLGITGAVGVTGNLTVDGTTITDGLVLTTGGATGYHLVATDNLSTAEWTRLEVNVQTVSGLGNTVTTNIRDYMYVIGADTSSGPVTLSLPTASYGKIMVHVKDIGANSFANNITISPDGSDTIVTTITGDTSVILSADGGALIFVSDGISSWWLM